MFFQSLILPSCELYYLNVFIRVLQIDDALEYFKTMRKVIDQKLKANLHREKVFVKFEWLSREFNAFIDHYCETLAFIDDSKEPSKAVLEKIINIKI